VVGKRSVMSYLLWPMMKAMDEAIREPWELISKHVLTY
jgi:HlyD family secretion protein